MKNTPPKSMNPAGVIHIDDDQLFSLCVKETLEKNRNIEVLRNYEQAGDFLIDLPNLPAFDVLIVDHVMADMSSDELARHINHKKIKANIISFSGQDDAAYLDKIKDAGIHHILPKHRLPDLELLVLKCTPHIQVNRHKDEVLLTTDDIVLLRMCCKNVSREMMAERLFIGKDAVKMRKKVLAQKLRIENKNMAFLAWGIKHGYFEL
jgi:DNA-binding NarL/FixJ family response regulator